MTTQAWLVVRERPDDVDGELEVVGGPYDFESQATDAVGRISVAGVYHVMLAVSQKTVEVEVKVMLKDRGG